MFDPAFLPPPTLTLPTLKPNPLHPCAPHIGPILSSASTPPSTPSSTPPLPISVGLTPKPGLTGTLCANLYPIPILGRYGWFLNVYRRSLPAKHGPYTLQIPADKSSITLSFKRNPEAPPQKIFKGIPQGNLNVSRLLKAISPSPADHHLRFFDNPGPEFFFQRKNDILLHPVPVPLPPWHDPAPTYSILTRSSAYQIRALHPGAGAPPRRVSKFEWFAMGLFPIFPFAAYSAFVCVWRQHPDMASVAIDKIGPEIRLSWFDPLELPEGTELPHKYATFAVKMFSGAVTDKAVTEQHRTLLAAIQSSPSTKVMSDSDFRVVVDNRPGVIAAKRKNEIWLQVE